MKKYFSLEEAQAQGLRTDITRSDIEEFLKNREQWEKFGKIEPRFYYSEHEGKFYTEYSEIIYHYKGQELLPYTDKYNGKNFRFLIPNLPKEERESTHKYEEPRPNNVGTPTAKKLDAWLEFLQAQRVFHIEKNTLRITREEEARKKIESIGQPINWKEDKMSGYIRNENIEYSFSIYSNGSIHGTLRLLKDNIEVLKDLFN